MTSLAPRENRCATCKWWVLTHLQDGEGECHRFAPSPEFGIPGDLWVVMPITKDYGWCGEYTKL